MSWRNGGSLKSADSFATGFAAGFVPAYQSSLDHKRDKEKMAMQEEKDMRLLQERERLARQRKGMGRAGGLSSQDKKDAKKVASSWSKAWSIVRSHGIHASQENLDFIFNRIHGSDGDGSQAITALRSDIENMAITFPTTGNLLPDPDHHVPDQGGDPVSTNAPIKVSPEEDNGNLATPVPFDNSSDSGGGGAIGETAAILSDVKPIDEPKLEGGPPEVVAQRERDAIDPAREIDESNGLQVASLGNSAMLEVALGEDPEKNIVATADAINASVTNESDESPYYGTDLNTIFGLTDQEDPNYIPLTNMAQARVLSQITMFPHVEQINQIKDISAVERNLAALGTRTDEAAIEMRQKLIRLRRTYAANGLPKPLEMTREQAVRFAEGGYQEYINKVPPDVLQRAVEQATKVAKMPTEALAYPATLQEQQLMMTNAQKGMYGPPEMWPDGWMSGLAEVMQKTKLQETFGPTLNIKTLNEMSIPELEHLNATIIKSGFTDGVPHPLVQDTLTFMRAVKEKNEYSGLTSGVKTSADTTVIMNRLDTENAMALSKGLPLPHDDNTLAAVAALHDSLLGQEEHARAERYSPQSVGTLRKAVVLVKNKRTGEMEPVLRNVKQGTTMSEWEPLPNADWSADNYVAWADTEALKALDNWNNDVQIERRELRGKQAVLRNTLQTVDRMSQIVDETGGSVLQAGAAVAQAANTLAFGGASIADVVGEWFSANPSATEITEAQLNAAMSQYNRGFQGNYTDWVRDSLPTRELGAQRARFEGLAILATFRLGAANDQTGQAMSNKDFERLSSVLTGTQTVQDFEQKMHDFVNPLIQEERALQGDLDYKREGFTSSNGFVPERKVRPMAETLEGSDMARGAYDRYSEAFQYENPGSSEYTEEVYNKVYNADEKDQIGIWRESVYEQFTKLIARPDTTEEDLKESVAAYATVIKGLDPSQLYGYLKGRYDEEASGQ